MSVNDPIGDMLTRIRNAIGVRRSYVVVPHSRLKAAVAQVLRDEGYIARFETLRDGKFPVLRLYLKYTEDGEPLITQIQRVSRSGRRVYVGAGKVPVVRSGFGVSILSTSRGVLTTKQAQEKNVGGELLLKGW